MSRRREGRVSSGASILGPVLAAAHISSFGDDDGVSLSTVRGRRALNQQQQYAVKSEPQNTAASSQPELRSQKPLENGEQDSLSSSQRQLDQFQYQQQQQQQQQQYEPSRTRTRRGDALEHFELLQLATLADASAAATPMPEPDDDDEEDSKRSAWRRPESTAARNRARQLAIERELSSFASASSTVAAAAFRAPIPPLRGPPGALVDRSELEICACDYCVGVVRVQVTLANGKSRLEDKEPLKFSRWREVLVQCFLQLRKLFPRSRWFHLSALRKYLEFHWSVIWEGAKISSAKKSPSLSAQSTHVVNTLRSATPTTFRSAGYKSGFWGLTQWFTELELSELPSDQVDSSDAESKVKTSAASNGAEAGDVVMDATAALIRDGTPQELIQWILHAQAARKRRQSVGPVRKATSVWALVCMSEAMLRGRAQAELAAAVDATSTVIPLGDMTLCIMCKAPLGSFATVRVVRGDKSSETFIKRRENAVAKRPCSYGLCTLCCERAQRQVGRTCDVHPFDNTDDSSGSSARRRAARSARTIKSEVDEGPVAVGSETSRPANAPITNAAKKTSKSTLENAVQAATKIGSNSANSTSASAAQVAATNGSAQTAVSEPDLTHETASTGSNKPITTGSKSAANDDTTKSQKKPTTRGYGEWSFPEKERFFTTLKNWHSARAAERDLDVAKTPGLMFPELAPGGVAANPNLFLKRVAQEVSDACQDVVSLPDAADGAELAIKAEQTGVQASRLQVVRGQSVNVDVVQNAAGRTQVSLVNGSRVPDLPSIVDVPTRQTIPAVRLVPGTSAILTRVADDTTGEVRSKSKEQVRQFYYRCVKRIKMLLAMTEIDQDEGMYTQALPVMSADKSAAAATTSATARSSKKRGAPKSASKPKKTSTRSAKVSATSTRATVKSSAAGNDVKVESSAGGKTESTAIDLGTSASLEPSDTEVLPLMLLLWHLSREHELKLATSTGKAKRRQLFAVTATSAARIEARRQVRSESGISIHKSANAAPSSSAAANSDNSKPDKPKKGRSAEVAEEALVLAGIAKKMRDALLNWRSLIQSHLQVAAQLVVEPTTTKTRKKSRKASAPNDDLSGSIDFVPLMIAPPPPIMPTQFAESELSGIDSLLSAAAVRAQNEVEPAKAVAGVKREFSQILPSAGSMQPIEQPPFAKRPRSPVEILYEPLEDKGVGKRRFGCVRVRSYLSHELVDFTIGDVVSVMSPQQDRPQHTVIKWFMNSATGATARVCDIQSSDSMSPVAARPDDAVLLELADIASREAHYVSLSQSSGSVSGQFERETLDDSSDDESGEDVVMRGGPSSDGAYRVENFRAPPPPVLPPSTSPLNFSIAHAIADEKQYIADGIVGVGGVSAEEAWDRVQTRLQSTLDRLRSADSFGLSQPSLILGREELTVPVRWLTLIATSRK